MVTVLDKLAKAEADAKAAYESLISTMATGGTVTDSKALEILRAAGKTAAELRTAVEAVQNRARLDEQVRAGELADKAYAKTQKEIVAFREELESAHAKLNADFHPRGVALDARIAELRVITEAGQRAVGELARLDRAARNQPAQAQPAGPRSRDDWEAVR